MTTATSITVRVPLAIRRRPGRKTIVTPMATGPAEATTHADPALVKALARAFRYQRMLDNGVYGSVTEMAAAENIDRGYLGRLLQLTLLAPDIVQDILNGKCPERIGLPVLISPLPSPWQDQRANLGLG
ncbi:putative cytosolic protein [Roseomonas mucosa]|uniref:Putative cytosolic protein n=1 Tax=Roseomonas mucosa TaxID=207340 RepID=A0A4Y1MU16_9PROT|nr:putative cytosolic protein [Roseomonas mucosa]